MGLTVKRISACCESSSLIKVIRALLLLYVNHLALALCDESKED